jgi:hypothetical protein
MLPAINPQVAVAALRYLAEDGSVPGRDLPGNEAQPGGEIVALGERIACADCRYHRAGTSQRAGNATGSSHGLKPPRSGCTATCWPARHYPRLWIQRPSSERRSSEIGSTFHGSNRPCQTLQSIAFGRLPGSTKSWKIFRPLPRCLLGRQRFLLSGPWCRRNDSGRLQ